MDNLIECRLKSCSGEEYLVPAELVEDFDRMADYIDENDSSDDPDYDSFCSEFDDKFGKYNLEGRLWGETALFVAQEIFE